MDEVTATIEMPATHRLTDIQAPRVQAEGLMDRGTSSATWWLAGTVSADPVTGRMPSGDEVTE